MRGLNLLVELARRATDERCAQLAEISLAKADVDAARTAHEQRQLSEASIAIDPATLLTVDAWSRHSVRYGNALSARQVELAQGEETARDALRSAFVDMKRLQTARDTMVRQERVLATRRADTRISDALASARLLSAA